MSTIITPFLSPTGDTPTITLTDDETAVLVEVVTHEGASTAGDLEHCHDNPDAFADGAQRAARAGRLVRQAQAGVLTVDDDTLGALRAVHDFEAAGLNDRVEYEPPLLDKIRHTVQTAAGVLARAESAAADVSQAACSCGARAFTPDGYCSVCASFWAGVDYGRRRSGIEALAAVARSASIDSHDMAEVVRRARSAVDADDLDPTDRIDWTTGHRPWLATGPEPLTDDERRGLAESLALEADAYAQVNSGSDSPDGFWWTDRFASIVQTMDDIHDGLPLRRDEDTRRTLTDLRQSEARTVADYGDTTNAGDRLTLIDRALHLAGAPATTDGGTA